MEEIDQELMKHMCKFCNKSFPNGRSLGGHMRSHVINSTDHHHHNYNQHQVKIKSCSSVLDKLCKVCGKGFQSWKALFGHMKCHSIKILNNKKKSIATLNQDSWTGDSDNENSDVKNRRIKRSRSRNRRNKRYKVATTTTGFTTASSLISMNANNNQISSNNASTSMVSEIELEQEADVAISLMMLSRNLGEWGYEIGSSEKCNNSSVFVNLCKAEGKDLIKNGSKMENPAGTQVNIDFIAKSKVGMIKSFKLHSGFGEFEDSNKRKFDCVACNKSFHSFQALGGHKASHKKLKRDFDSKIEIENENENEKKIKHKPISDHELTTNGYDPKTSDDHQESSSLNLGFGCLKKKIVVLGAHECPICFRIFSSGQALGGHKRSHLISEAKSNQENYTHVIKKPDELVHETHRVFLDLNMPPEEEEEMNMSSSTTEYKSYYWEDNSDHHSHESRLLSLLSTS